MEHLLNMPILIYSLWNQFFDTNGLLSKARTEDPNLGLYFYLGLDIENYGYGKDGNKRNPAWERKFFRVIHVIVTCRHRVYVAVVDENTLAPEMEREHDRLYLRDVTKLNPGLFENTSNHDSCWREDGLRVYRTQLMAAYKHCYEFMPDQERPHPEDMHVHTRFGSFLGYDKVVQLVRVQRESSLDERNNYRDHLTKIERVPFSVQVRTPSA